MESKSLIIYKSKYGAARRYAGWIAQKTGAAIYDLADLELSHFIQVDDPQANLVTQFTRLIEIPIQAVKTPR